MAEEPVSNFEVTFVEAARGEAKKVLRVPEHYLFCVQQARLLRFFPARSGKREGGFFALDIKRIEDYWELRVWDKILGHRNIRIMFAVFERPKEVVILSVYQKQTEQTPLLVKVRCRNRIRKLVQRGYRR